MDRVRKSFKVYFSDIDLPEIIEKRGEVAQSGGWAIRYVMTQDENGHPCLDCYAKNRRTNDRHVRILHDGTVIELEAPQDDSTYVEGVEARVLEEFYAYNQRIYSILKGKGLLD